MTAKTIEISPEHTPGAGSRQVIVGGTDAFDTVNINLLGSIPDFKFDDCTDCKRRIVTSQRGGGIIFILKSSTLLLV